MTLLVVWQEAVLWMLLGGVIVFLVTVETFAWSSRRRERERRPGYIPFGGPQP